MLCTTALHLSPNPNPDLDTHTEASPQSLTEPLTPGSSCATAARSTQAPPATSCQWSAPQTARQQEAGPDPAPAATSYPRRARGASCTPTTRRCGCRSRCSAWSQAVCLPASQSLCRMSWLTAVNREVRAGDIMTRLIMLYLFGWRPITGSTRGSDWQIHFCQQRRCCRQMNSHVPATVLCPGGQCPLYCAEPAHTD